MRSSIKILAAIRIQSFAVGEKQMDVACDTLAPRKTAEGKHNALWICFAGGAEFARLHEAFDWYNGGAMAWEYTVETIPLDHTGPTPNEILNALGSDGWELVSVVSQAASGSIYVILFLKRQIAAALSSEGGREANPNGNTNTNGNAKSGQLPRLMKRVRSKHVPDV